MSSDVSNIGMDSLERCCCVVESIQSRQPWLEKKVLGRVLELSRNGRVCNDERCPCGDPEFSPIYLFCDFSWSPPVPKILH